MSATAEETKQATETKPSLEDVSDAYKSLVSKLTTLGLLQRVSGLLNYDQMVFMPAKAAPERGAQMSAMAGVVHEKSTDPELLTLMEKAQSDLSATGNDKDFKDEARLLELEHKDFIQNARVSKELASEKAALKASAHAAWAKAREQKDFSVFEPLLKKCFDLVKQEAEAKLGDNPDNISHYTHMLDQYEMGMAPERLDDIFDQIQQALVPLIAKVWGETATPPSTDPIKSKQPFDEEKQKELSRKIVTQLGYNVDCGRIDKAVHPFTMSVSPSDVRITSRYLPDNWYNGLAASIHESGHAMYEQNLPSQANGGAKNGPLQVDAALSLGMHESQSLFWERHISLSKPFWVWATPLVKEVFPDLDYTPEEVYKAVNAVRKSLIRVEADELAYPLHVILRYRMEREVVSGKLEVADIPARWNAQMKELLGIDEIPSDAVGCLQDIHWSMMAIGYFPTYLVGSSTAAQLAYYCKNDIANFDELVAKGEFSEIKAWLTKKVHRHGKRYRSLDDLLESELGEPLNPKYFIDYLTEKYTDIYQC